MKKPNRITVDSRPVFRKRKLHFNTDVSSNSDEFSCEGEADIISYRFVDMIQDLDDLINGLTSNMNKRRVSTSYGISKREHLVSDHYTINGMRSAVGI